MIESYRNIYSKLEDIPTKYITAKQLSNLKSLGINTVYDLIYYFPRAYDDRTNIKKIGELKFNEYVVLKAKLHSLSFWYFHTHHNLITKLLEVDQYPLELDIRDKI